MDTWNLVDDDGDEDREEDDDGQWMYGGKSASIFLIDAAQEMFEDPDDQDDDKESPFICSVKAAHATLMRKVISSDQDLLAVVLFNTRETKNPLDYPNIYVLQELERPGAEKILGLESLMEMSKAEFNKDYGQTTSASIHDALRVCQSVFTKCKSRLAGQSILLFTCRDDPHVGEDQRKRQARSKARDLREAGIILEVLHLGQAFDINKFYKELVIADEEDDDDNLTREHRTLADPTERLTELMDRVRRLEHKQRTTGRVAFTLTPGVEFSVGVYTIVRKMAKPAKMSLWKNTNEDVRVMRKEYLEETGELLMPSDYVKFQWYGGKKLKFTVDEVKSMKRVYDVGIKLLGFKPIDRIKPYHCSKNANFLYPDEKSVQGSTKLFAALYERCLARKMAPIVRFSARKGSNVTYAALIPQTEKYDERKSQVLPSGFIACHLPFVDDLRNLQIQNRERASSDQVDAAKKMVKKLHFKYSPENFDNPDIQTLWENIKALALNRAQVESVEDFTVPNHEVMDRKAGNEIEAFKNVVYPSSYDPTQVIKRPSASSTPAAKRPKPDPSTIDVELEAKQGRANKLTVDLLKKWLIGRGVPVTGRKKAELIQAVMDEVEA